MRVNSPEFNSVDFTSDDFQFINFFSRDYPHNCGNAGDEFYVTIVRNMSTEGGDVVRLQLSLREGKDQFEFGKNIFLKRLIILIPESAFDWTVIFTNIM